MFVEAAATFCITPAALIQKFLADCSAPVPTHERTHAMGIKFRPELVAWDAESGQNIVKKYERLSAAYGAYDPEQECFYCNAKLSGEAVLFWGGDKQDLLLHPGCFLELSVRLFRDLHNVEVGMDYRVIRNASPLPPALPREDRSKEAWSRWRKLRDSMRDHSLVRQ